MLSSEEKILFKSISQAIKVSTSAISFDRNINIGDNLFLTTNLAIKEKSATILSVRNAADSANRDLNILNLRLDSGCYFDVDGNMLRSPTGDNTYTNISARDNGVGTIPIARLCGAADPFFAITGVMATTPVNTNLSIGFWTIGYVSGGNATLYVNDAGTIKTLVLGAPA